MTNVFQRKCHSKMAVAVLATMVATVSYAELDSTLDVPNASIVFYVHGHLNLVFASNDTTGTYATFVSGSAESAFAYDVETRPVGGGEWTACAGALSKYSGSDRDFRDTTRFYWLGSTEIVETAEVRARIRITKEGDSKYGHWSDWGSLGSVEIVNELNGRIIQSAETAKAGLADDGDVNTFFEDSNTSPDVWTGIDAVVPSFVSRIRFTHRNYNTQVQNRGKGAVFEAANAADFSDAVQIYVVPNGYNPLAVNDISLETPVKARYFRVRTSKSNCCNFTEVQWVGGSSCTAAVSGDGGESDYRARVAALGDKSNIATLRLLRGYCSSGPFVGITAPLAADEPLFAVDETSGVGLPCYYCWECTMDSGVVLTGAVSSVYTRPRQLERDAANQSAFGDGVEMLPVDALSPGVKFSNEGTVPYAFDGNLDTTPNAYFGKTNPVVGVSLAVPAHFSCAYVNAWCENAERVKRMKRLKFYGSESRISLDAGQYHQLADPITDYQATVDDRKWFRYDSTDTNGLYACLFGYTPFEDGQWCGHAREIRFVGWTETDAIASGKVLAPEGVSANCANNAVSVGWTAAVNATSLKIERRQQGIDEWALVAANADPLALSHVDTDKLRSNTVYEYRVTATGLGGLMSVAAEPVSVKTPRPGFALIFR